MLEILSTHQALRFTDQLVKATIRLIIMETAVQNQVSELPTTEPIMSFETHRQDG